MDKESLYDENEMYTKTACVLGRDFSNMIEHFMFDACEKHPTQEVDTVLHSEISCLMAEIRIKQRHKNPINPPKKDKENAR